MVVPAFEKTEQETRKPTRLLLLMTAATNHLWVIHRSTVNGDDVLVNSEIVIVFLGL